MSCMETKIKLQFLHFKSIALIQSTNTSVLNKAKIVVHHSLAQPIVLPERHISFTKAIKFLEFLHGFDERQRGLIRLLFGPRLQQLLCHRSQSACTVFF